MRPGWYILNYHNVDYEDSILTRPLGGTTRPDVFIHHLDLLSQVGRFISIPQGQETLDSGKPITEPLFSLWFDDGLAGVSQYALPICQSYGIRAALSICSRFVLREEMFWRAKMSYLAQTDALRFLRARFRRAYSGVPLRVGTWSVRNFERAMVEHIDAVYRRFSTEVFRNDAFRVFGDRRGLRELADAGWTLTNHSAAHYPLAPGRDWKEIEGEFDECEELVREFNPDNRYWVIPFGFGSDHFRERLRQRATVVEVGEQRNTANTWSTTGRIFRYSAPATRDIRATLR